MSGENKIAAMQSILQYRFSPGFDKLEEELRKFEGLVKTYHASLRWGISDSIAQAVIKSQMPAEIRPHLELQIFTRTTELISLMSSLSKIRTATTSPNVAALGPVPVESGWVKNKDKGKNKEKGKGRSKSEGKGNEKPKNKKFEGWCSNCRKWSHNVAKCWHGKENRSMSVVQTDGHKCRRERDGTHRVRE